MDEKKRKPSRIPHWLSWAFWLMALLNLGRTLQSYWNVDLLTGRETSLSPWVWLVLSLLWAAGFGAAGWGLTRRLRWAWPLGMALPPIYGLYRVGMTLLFTQSAYIRGGWGLTALNWLLASLLVVWLLTRERVQYQFQKVDQNGAGN